MTAGAARAGGAAVRAASFVRRVMRPVLDKQSAPRQAGLLFIIVGIIGVANDIAPYTLGHGQIESTIVDLVNIGVGVGCFIVPWSRWKPRRTLALAVIALANVAWSNSVTLGSGPSYGIFFIVVFAWVGAWHRQWTAVLLSPLAVLAYLAPVLTGSDVPAGTLTSLPVVIPVGVLIAETIAHNAELARRGAAQLRYQALHDALTGLPNRALILDRTERMLARSRRSRQPVAALFVDLDNFKDINDTLGHGAGDQLLRAVAERLISAVRQADSVGRIGGDEFVVLVEDAVMGANPELVAQRILDVLREPFYLLDVGTAHVVTASIGIAAGQRASADDLLRDADFALYRAKAAGKNGFALFQDEMLRTVTSNGEFEAELRTAIGTDQFFLLYQPTFAIGTGTATGVEALLRWRHPTRGIIGAGEFVPILEETGLILTVGRWVLTQACIDGCRWNRAGRPVVMSVNISAKQLETDTLVGDVRDALEQSGLDPHNLVLELSESSFLQRPADAATRLRTLKDLGVRIAIDEFGTCYSSLASLREFPVDMLKIDQSIIASLTTNSQARAIVHTLVQLGRTLGLETVAQGIEEPEQLAELEAAGCETGQGFIYAHPLKSRDIDQLLNRALPLAGPTRPDPVPSPIPPVRVVPGRRHG